MDGYLFPFILIFIGFVLAILALVYLLSKVDRSKRTVSGIFSAVFLLLMVGSDRLSKVYAVNNFSRTGTETVIPGILGYSYTFNSGAAWGILSGSTWLLALISLAISLICLYFIFVKPLYSPWSQAALILITAGGLGNLYDRIVLGGVTDFLVFLFMNFPLFNLADSCVTTGAGILIVYMFFSSQNAPLLLQTQKAPDEGLGDESQQ